MHSDDTRASDEGRYPPKVAKLPIIETTYLKYNFRQTYLPHGALSGARSQVIAS